MRFLSATFLAALLSALCPAASPAQPPPVAPFGEVPTALPTPEPAPAPSRNASGRSTEIVRLECASDLGRREVTLFGNGTVRLREGLKEDKEQGLGLAELDPDELAGALARLAGEDLSEVRWLPSGVEGAWIERCNLHLALPGVAARSFRFGRYDTLPLPLSRVLRVVEDLAAEVKDLHGIEELPPDYQLRPGDVLKRVDGQLFEIYAFTTDNRGVEMWGVDQPLTLYVPVTEVRREFVFLVSRSRTGRTPRP